MNVFNCLEMLIEFFFSFFSLRFPLTSFLFDSFIELLRLVFWLPTLFNLSPLGQNKVCVYCSFEQFSQGGPLFATRTSLRLRRFVLVVSAFVQVETDVLQAYCMENPFRFCLFVVNKVVVASQKLSCSLVVVLQRRLVFEFDDVLSLQLLQKLSFLLNL